MPKQRLLASLAVAGAIAVGGVAGYLVGVPGVSGAQTTDSPTTTAPPTTVAPDEDAARGPGGRDGNCPEKDQRGPDGSAPEGSSSGTGATSTGLRRGGGRFL